MTDSRITVGCAGAGTLGAAIMRRPISCGHDVRVWNRTPARLEPVLAAGAAAVDSPADLARAADLVVVCVTDGAAVEATVFGDGGIACAGSPEKIPEALAGGRADSRLLQEFMAKMARSDFAKVEGRLALMLKDLAMIGELAKRSGAVMPVTSLVEQLHRKLVADGLGDADNTEFVRLYRDRV